MKKINILRISLAFFALICGSCKENEMDPTFLGESRALIGGLAAEGAGIKTLSFSFSTYQDTQREMRLNLVVQSMGNISTAARTVKLGIDTLLTTALAEEYEFPSSVTIPAGQFKVLAPITLKRTDRLKAISVKLAIKVLKSDDFLPGPPQEGGLGAGLGPVFEINYTDVFVKPGYWDVSGSLNMSTYFGIWSIAKHRLMVEVSGIRDFSKLTSREKYIIQSKGIDYLFKYNTEHPTAPYVNETGIAISFCNNCP